MSDARFDVVVVGAGMVGAALAAVLAGSNRQVLLIDRRQPPDYDFDRPAGDAGFDLRVSAVNLATEQLLTRLGIWPTIMNTQAQAFRHMQVWDAAGRGRTSFHATEIDEAHLGHIVENSLLSHCLLEHAVNASNVDTRWDVSLSNLAVGADGVGVDLDNGDRVETRLVVGADGGRSQVRAQCGIAAPTYDYRQRTLVAPLQTSKSLRETAWQRFLPTGPIALLPLGDRLASLAWHIDRDEAATIEAMDDAAFGAAITDKTQAVAGEIEVIGPRGGFDLFRLHAHDYVAERVALIGDAAHVVHPLAGLGVNLGFMDAAVLGECLLNENRADAGDARSLRAYARRRRLDNTLTVAATDVFKHGFGARAAPIETLRNIGLLLADRSGPIKREVLRFATGLGGDIPALARRH